MLKIVKEYIKESEKSVLVSAAEEWEFIKSCLSKISSEDQRICLGII